MRIVLALLLAACGAAAPAPVAAPAPAARVPVVSTASAHYAIFEGPSFKNDCRADADCKIGGCGGELCTAEPDVVTACVGYSDQPRDATCGCVARQCVWYRLK